MIRMTPKRMAAACGGLLHVPENAPEMADQEVTLVTTDSRKAEYGCAFAAIKGERVDGHSFIPAVMEKGAFCIIAEQEPAEAITSCWIKVMSTGNALKDIAQYYLEVLHIPVVGIAGSVGKTSTKEMVASVLSQKYQTLKTLGNFNNELGLPLTVFRLTQEHEIAVLEMGISDFGEMHRLARVAKPDTVVMTNIGECHLEFLGDRDGVLRAKSEIFDFLKADAHIVLNGNDDKLVTIRSVNGVEPVFFGIGEQENVKDPTGACGKVLDVYADEIEPQGLDGTDCMIHANGKAFKVHIPIPGKHMVMNALAATAVGLAYELNIEQIQEGIAAVQPVGGRVNLIHAGSRIIIDDCYNANPISMKAAIGVLKDAKGHSCAILGDMAELGENEKAFHEEIGQYAAASGIDKLIAIGRRSEDMAKAARDHKSAMQVAYYPTLDEFIQNWKNEILAEDTVLVKASHSMGFERIVKLLQEG